VLSICFISEPVGHVLHLEKISNIDISNFFIGESVLSPECLSIPVIR